MNGRYGAVVEKVKQGSVADLVGHLLPGDEVLEWNGVSLQGRTYEDVGDIIVASRQDRCIELVVSRDVDVSRRLGAPDPSHAMSSFWPDGDKHISGTVMTEIAVLLHHLGN